MATKILTAALVVVTLLLGYVLYQSLEIYQDSVDAGWTLNARRNPFLATEMLMTEMGAKAESSGSKSAINNINDFTNVLITNSALVLNEPMADALLEWVDKGGHLVLGASAKGGVVLERLGVEYESIVYEYDEVEEPLTGDRGWTYRGEKTEFEKALTELDDDECENKENASDEDEHNDKDLKNKDENKDKNKDIEPSKKNAKRKQDKNCDKATNNSQTTPRKPEKKLSELLKEANKKMNEKAEAESTAKESGKEPNSDAQSTPSPFLDNTKTKSEVIPERRITRLKFKGLDNSVKIAFSPWSIISHPYIADQKDEHPYKPFYWGSSDRGEQFMQFEIGKGIVTVVSDASVWDSHQLARLDHAFLLKVMGLHEGRLLILYGVSIPSITEIAWAKFPELIITLALLIILCLWLKAVRVGPVRRVHTVVRRSIVDSINGLASYQHKRKKYGKLLQPLVADINALANRQITGFSVANSTQKNALISAHSGLSEQTITQAMNPDTVHDDVTFQNSIQLLRTIRKTL